MNNRNPFRKAREDMCPYEHLYHATWLFNLERILSKGLLPKDNGSRNFMDCKLGVYLSNDPEIGVSCLETTENENIDDPDDAIKVIFAVKSELVLPNLFVDSSYHFDDDPDDKIISFRFDGIIRPSDIDIVTHTGYNDLRNVVLKHMGSLDSITC